MKKIVRKLMMEVTMMVLWGLINKALLEVWIYLDLLLHFNVGSHGPRNMIIIVAGFHDRPFDSLYVKLHGPISLNIIKTRSNNYPPSSKDNIDNPSFKCSPFEASWTRPENKEHRSRSIDQSSSSGKFLKRKDYQY